MVGGSRPEMNSNRRTRTEAFKKVAPQEIQYMRNNNFCWKFGDQWGPGHLCKMKQVNMIVAEEGDDVGDFYLIGEEIEDAGVIEEITKAQLHAITQLEDCCALRDEKRKLIVILGYIGDILIKILIDTGAAKSFLDMVDGHKVRNDQVCLGTQWTIQQHHFKFDLKLLELGGWDLILDILHLHVGEVIKLSSTLHVGLLILTLQYTLLFFRVAELNCNGLKNYFSSLIPKVFLKIMEESPPVSASDGKITGITFSLATREEICKASISDCGISHASQLSNPFLGLPLEVGKCESCGTSEPGQCEGHFGYIELPMAIYHPDHVGELKQMLSLLCLKCLKFKNRKLQVKNVGVIERMFSCCEEVSQVVVEEVKTQEGACYLLLKVPSRKKVQDNFWSFLEKYGFRYSNKNHRPLLPSEVMRILKKIPQETRKKLATKGFFPQEGYVLQYLPVPPNCLSIPDISDGTTITSRDHSIFLLKRVLKQIEVIKNSRSGMPNFESHLIEVNELQAAISEYFQFRGTGKASRDVDARFGVTKEPTSSKAWLEKMKTLFIRKSSGFSSRSVITGDPYIGVNQIGLPLEIAQKITFEERVSKHNIRYLQRLVDEKLCLTYRDGMSTYSLREGSKGHTFLRPGQVVHRRIMDGDMVFINRPPTTHKHSLQALSVYIHDDHTVKINPLICGPLSADFDGDCIHLFYPQSLAARAEVLELFSVEKQLLSSHTGNFNLQMAADSLLSLKLMFERYFFGGVTAQQLMMFVSELLPEPAVMKSCSTGNMWTVLQILQAALPPSFDCSGERYTTHRNALVKFDYIRDLLQSSFTEIVTSILFSKGPKEVVNFFNSLTPLLMENVHSEGFSVCLEDFCIPEEYYDNAQVNLRSITQLLRGMRSSQSESLHLEINNRLRAVRMPMSNLVQSSSAIGLLMDSKSEGALNKVIQQIGFLGMQLSDKGQFYTKTLISDLEQLFQRKYPSRGKYPFEEYGFVRSCLFHGLDPYQEMIHSVSSREVIVRSSRGLTEPGTLFKNLMAILRDVVICYDGTVRNVCSNSIIQFEYGTNGFMFSNEFGAGEPVGVLAATAMSNPAYKAVLDSSPSSNSSWEMMKDILLCGVNFKNDVSDRRAILYLKDCACGRKFCKENAAYVVKDHLKKVSLQDAAMELLIEYGGPLSYDSSEIDNGLVAHVHLNQEFIRRHNISMKTILSKCEDTISSLQKGKRTASKFKRVTVQVSEYCSFQQSSNGSPVPCLTILQGASGSDLVDQTSHDLAEVICPPLLETVLKGDPRVSAANIIWVNSDTPTWIRSPTKSQKGELALDVILEKHAVKKTGDAWRVVMDSCIPVMHLIDSNRSIPYAIKQVQELLGISCAFEQAVQRLSTSVTMVTRGVLKDHLVLLGNSMTYGGNLIGFNIGGIKALSRSLNVQVPFMEATLSAPRRCFERAAEKQHVDSLSSVVASCAWGKQVAVGTGSAFDLILDTRKVELSEACGTDVYDFLQLVGGGFAAEETNTGCLGAEIENLDMEDEAMDGDLSPVRDSDKPTFEDILELDGNSDEHDWKGDPPQTTQSSGGWEQANKGQSGGWEQAKKSESGGWEQAKKSESGGWEQAKKAQGDGGTTRASDSAWSAWGDRAGVKETGFSNAESGGWEHAKKGHSNGVSTRASDLAGSSWGVVQGDKETVFSNTSNSGWEQAKKDEGGGWEQPKKDEGGGWEQAKKGEGGGWEQLKKGQSNGVTTTESNVPWSAWGAGAGDKETGFPSTVKDDTLSFDQWNVEKTEKSWKKSGSFVGGKMADSDTDSLHAVKSCGNWEAASNKAQGIGISSRASDSTKSCWGPAATEALHQTSAKYDDEWGSKKPPSTGKQLESSSAWGKKFDTQENSSSIDKSTGGWDQKNGPGKAGEDDTAASSSGWSTWGGRQLKEDNFSTKRQQSFPSHDRCSIEEPQSASNQIGTSVGELTFNSEINSTLGCWERETDKGLNVETQRSATDSWSSWGQGASKQSSSSAWEKKIHNKRDSPTTAKGGGSWKQAADEVHDVATQTIAADSACSSWGDGKSKTEDEFSKCARGASTGSPEWGAKESPKEGGSSWGKRVSASDTWSKKNEHQSRWSKGDAKKDDHQSKWSKGDANRSRQSWGSSSRGEWKNKSNPPNKVMDNFKAGGMFTLTRQRLDQFTVEEQEVLSDAEQIIQNIRRIMHQTGYNDGDLLSPEDQSYVCDYVLSHHPDKASKIGAGIQHIMVDKHTNFQDTRCFFVVSTDNQKQDFSYRKSLENYIKGKYPDKAEAFLGKYFKRTQPRTGSTQESPTETGTLGEGQ
ncbi:OLC1v1013446C1 [Oldenlandia corymbosa var. corymbosa]|uniref:DNA-directed RNA polymerase subunit n=1 Tax=Oldenlandia corymbosa var. corymbosa TaxID=529605 RepID=A0AAV1DYG7_OLDCO|nr:OLC1v1013446C1 [Oldenlandia corymbosa var. corymbosa]